MPDREDIAMRCIKAVAVLTMITGFLSAAAQERDFRFLKEEAGKVPAGWKVEKTGKGEGSVWKVVEDDTGPGKTGYVLAQTAQSPSSLFNVCVAETASRILK
jgi:hypothetical protein